MAEAAAPGNSNAPPVEAPSSVATAATTLYPDKPAETAKPAEVKTDAVAATETPKPAAESTTGSEPAKAEVAKQEATPTVDPTLFTLPDDFKVTDSMKTKLTEVLKSGVSGDKVALTGQQISDTFVALAREANTAWEQQLKDLDASNAAACKKGFTAAELTGAETAVGWVTSRFDPTFREGYAKRQLNDPAFVRLMTLIHDAYLAEDTFETGNKPAPAPDKRPLRQRAQEQLYGRKAN